MSNALSGYLKERSHHRRYVKKQSASQLPASPLVTYDHPDIHIGGHIGNVTFVIGSTRVLCIACRCFYYDDAPVTRVTLHCPYCAASHFMQAPSVLGDNPTNVLTSSTADENVHYGDEIELTTKGG